MSEGNDTKQVVFCDFCFHRCGGTAAGRVGACGVRRFNGKQWEPIAPDYIAAMGIDPIEKKPIYHVHPGSKTFSYAMPGCDYTCEFCQNHRIAQVRDARIPLTGTKETCFSPEQMVALMSANGLRMMSYTYTEPAVWQDHLLETARRVHAVGGLNCVVTNGSFTPEAMGRIAPYIDAWNIDLKGDDHFYRSICGGRAADVLECIDRALASGAVVEVTTLLIEAEGLHTLEMVERLGERLRRSGVSVWHLSRFYPAYRMISSPPTSEQFLHEALVIAAASGIPFIYSGNSIDTEFGDTRCTGCGRILVSDRGFRHGLRKVAEGALDEGRCVSCGTRLYGLF